MTFYGKARVELHSFLTVVLDEDEWPVSNPSRFNLYKLKRRLGGPQSRSGRFGEEMFVIPSGNRTTIFRLFSLQPSHYTDRLGRLAHTHIPQSCGK
jgi:hypothetical protein